MRTSYTIGEIIKRCPVCKGTGQYVATDMYEEPLACMRCGDLLKIQRRVLALEDITYDVVRQLLDIDTEHRYASDPELYALLHKIGGHDGGWNGNTGICDASTQV